MVAPRKSLAAERRWVLDYAAIVWLSMGISAGAVIGLVYVIPTVCPDPSSLCRRFNSGLLIYGLALLVANWALIRRTPTAVPRNARTRVPEEAEGAAEGATSEAPPSCDECRTLIVRRTHHCKLCRVCVLKHDHHCFFAARCVGFANQRYFVVFTFWVGFGLSYSFFFFLAYWRGLAEGEGGRWFDFLLIPVAMGKWALGFLSSFDLLCIFLFHSCIVGSFAGVLLCSAQLRLILGGLTSYEKKKKLGPPAWSARLSPREHMRMTFGPHWLLNFFFPIGPWVQLQPYPDVQCTSYADQKHV